MSIPGKGNHRKTVAVFLFLSLAVTAVELKANIPVRVNGSCDKHHKSVISFLQTDTDTSLSEICRLFYAAMEKHIITGSQSAEYYFDLMCNKFPGNVFLTDAENAIAFEYINTAMLRINDYLDCMDDEGNAVEKQENFRSGERLEKAIHILDDYDPEFAQSFRAAMYFLKASGDFGDQGKNGQLGKGISYAYMALALKPDAAFIHNRLSKLYLAEGCIEKAAYHSGEAKRLAPGWKCSQETNKIVLQRTKDLQ